jgi:hypothetical protein
VAKLLDQLKIEFERIFPEDLSQAPEWVTSRGIPSYLWGWQRLEVGLMVLRPPALEHETPLLGWDQATYDRNKWIYEHMCSGVILKSIITDLGKITKWESIASDSGIKRAAKAFAQRSRLPVPPPRHRGRPSSPNK